MPADEQHVMHLKTLLHQLSHSTGLFVKFSKSTMVPINIDQHQGTHLANCFGCKTESLPFTYLGLPLGTTKPSVRDLLPVIARIDKRLSGVASLMTYAGRLTYINYVLSMPISAMCTFKVHRTILNHVNKSSRTFLWYGKDINKRGNCLAKWNMVCKPKDEGGLGVLNLRVQNVALLMKHLHKFYNHADVPWVNLIWQAYHPNHSVPHASSPRGSFWWKDCMSPTDIYRSLTSCLAGKGDTTLLWKDIWNGDIMQRKFPKLHTFAYDDNISIMNAKHPIFLQHVPVATIN